MAFVIHLTVFQSTGKNNDLNPGNDFQLLLPDGTPAGVVNCTIYDDLRQL